MTRRARKTNRILEKYKTNQRKLVAEFANLNPQAKEILSKDAKKTLTTELAELEKTKGTRKERRKKASALAKVHQKLNDESSN